MRKRRCERLRKKAFYMLKIACYTESKIRLFREKNEQRRKYETLELCLRNWQRFTIIEKIIAAKRYEVN